MACRKEVPTPRAGCEAVCGDTSSLPRAKQGRRPFRESAEGGKEEGGLLILSPVCGAPLAPGLLSTEPANGDLVKNTFVFLQPENLLSQMNLIMFTARPP